MTLLEIIFKLRPQQNLDVLERTEALKQVILEAYHKDERYSEIAV